MADHLQPILQAENISLSFSGKKVLDSVNLALSPGEFTGIIGPNGSGKTSLLRILDGIYKPDAGTVLLEGRTLASYRPKERARKISFMTQGDTAAVTFSVLEVVASGRYPYEESAFQNTSDDSDRADAALSRVGLVGLEERRFDTLSSGEKQLVMFARVLVQDTPVILLDEPTSNLDISHQERIFSVAASLARDGKTVIASIHAVNEASRWCSRIILLEKGKKTADGAPEIIMDPSYLDRPFAVKTAAINETLTGKREIRVLPCRKERTEACRIHILGGAGSSLEITRKLYGEGFLLTGSPVGAADPDAVLWTALSVPFTEVGAFMYPSGEDLDRERELLKESDFTVVCFSSVGPWNQAVLETAAASKVPMILMNGNNSAPVCDHLRLNNIPFTLMDAETLSALNTPKS